MSAICRSLAAGGVTRFGGNTGSLAAPGILAPRDAAPITSRGRGADAPAARRGVTSTIPLSPTCAVTARGRIGARTAALPVGTPRAPGQSASASRAAR